jgi:hypothetical protein
MHVEVPVATSEILEARRFVDAAVLPAPPPPTRAAAAAAGAFDFDAAREQAAVVGSDVIAFVKGVTPEQRSDVVNASLLAQLVAKKSHPEPKTLAAVTAWYDSYFEALSHIGFVIQDKGFAEYRHRSDTFEAHEAILEVAGALLAGAPGALVVVRKTLEALQKMSADSPWITLFHRESQSANTARFQVSVVDAEEDARFLVSLIAFGLEAERNVTQVLFFKFHRNAVTLQHHSGKVTINVPVLEGVRAQIADKLRRHADEYVAALDV